MTHERHLELKDQPKAVPTLPVRYGKFTRLLYGGLGFLFLGIAVAGVILPGVPTTGPLLLASFFLAKCDERLERRLIRNRWLGPYLQYVDGSEPMPMRARVAAIAWMWIGISLSSMLFLRRGYPFAIVVTLMAGLGLMGTFFILRFRKPKETMSPTSDSQFRLEHSCSDSETAELLTLSVRIDELAHEASYGKVQTDNFSHVSKANVNYVSSKAVS